MFDTQFHVRSHGQHEGALVSLWSHVENKHIGPWFVNSRDGAGIQASDYMADALRDVQESHILTKKDAIALYKNEADRHGLIREAVKF